jgi:hypothetical protein
MLSVFVLNVVMLSVVAARKDNNLKTLEQKLSRDIKSCRIRIVKDNLDFLLTCG